MIVLLEVSSAGKMIARKHGFVFSLAVLNGNGEETMARWVRVFFVAGLLVTGLGSSLPGDELEQIGNDEFDRLHEMIRRRLGESRWMEIDWYPSVWEARRKAAETGKPIFLMAGSGGAPAAGC